MALPLLEVPCSFYSSPSSSHHPPRPTETAENRLQLVPRPSPPRVNAGATVGCDLPPQNVRQIKNLSHLRFSFAPFNERFFRNQTALARAHLYKRCRHADTFPGSAGVIVPASGAEREGERDREGRDGDYGRVAGAMKKKMRRV